ncbi:DNA polymerase I [Acholeplasma hippikon]|uniref:DNA polymerase I n=1 Tax=Acholeplasma hippikon TaxID=264636 RepID=A0A449BJK4_9MOLU|nr:DNA polymerase I [Acholeplasma hippikon]VEU82644.1 DNA polymerase I [Acholeplasma hippikon]
MKKLTLVDGNSLLFRAYYATAYPGAKILQTSTGIYTNAVFAFANMLEKIIEVGNGHMLIAFDTGKPTKRHLAYEGYKAGRKAMPEELASQIPLIHELIKYLGIKEFSFEGYEADDIIGTLAKRAAKAGYEVDVYSSDRDLLQLVDEKITVHMLKSGMKVVEDYTPETLLERYGLTHEQFVDLKALMGDQSDNIPGVPGVGEKTAVTLLQKYKNLETIIEKKEEITGKLGEKIREHAESAIFSKELSTIDTDAPLPFGVEDTLVNDVMEEELINFYKRLELKQLVIQTRKKSDIKAEPKNFEYNYEAIETEEKLTEILNKDLSVYFEFSDFNYHKATLWGIGLSDGIKSYFVSKELFDESDALKTYLSNPNYKKFTYNFKGVLVYLMHHGLSIENVTYDLLLAAYIIKSSIGKEDFTNIAQLFDIQHLSYDEEIYGKGAKKALPLIVSDYENHISKKAFVIVELMDKTLEILKEREQLHLLNEIELPLSKVIAEMEFEGLLVDQEELLNQTKNLESRIKVLKDEIIDLAGKNFNIDSPKQLGDVLFETLGLPNGKKTKTGYSTDVEVLTYLYDRHPIIPKVMEYRQLTKLYSTYLIGIKESIFKDGKVHTIFNQALTLTGRLSSLEPNLQNIPTRTEEGRLIRKIFVPKPGNYLLGADYSQIELRVLADMADVKNLQEAFLHGEDIHTSTAKKVFHVETVDSEQRRKAKAVNFGIIYGIGAWSLSEDINVTVKEAEAFIQRYLEVYPEIKQYMTDIVEFAKKHGYVETIMKRRRYIPELESKVFQLREFGKRTALNAPVQGSAADIIKVAMINLYKYLKENNKKSKLILQVHDELILDTVLEELEEMKIMVPKIMKEAVKLKVNLDTSCDTGKTWYDL